MEWRFRADSIIGAVSGCDAELRIVYRFIQAIVFLHGDAAVSFDLSSRVTGLDPSQFQTYRFESVDGGAYTVSVNGEVFIERNLPLNDQRWSFIDMSTYGSCDGNGIDEWDFVRYGTIGSGEQMVSVDPPSGSTLSAAEGAQSRSFTLTFDKPAHLYIDDIDVTATGGTPPTIAATKRLDNGPAEVLEVFIGGGLPPGETTTFTFDTGTGPQSVSYYRDQPEIPATSGRGAVVTALLALIVGSVTFRRSRRATP